MKFPKLPVYAKIICAGSISSYLIHSFIENSKKREEMVIKTCDHDCRPTAQKLKLICPTGPGESKKFVITGNWKMNGDKRMADNLLKILRCGHVKEGNQVILGVPAPYIDYVQQKKPEFVEVAAQNIYKEGKGPFTGEISAEMLLDIGAKYVILGAAERKTVFHEDYDLIGEKADYALEKGLHVILCIGETQAERERNEHIKALHQQLSTILQHVPKHKWKRMIIVYEPLWASITDRMDTPEEVKEVAGGIRKWLTDNVDKEMNSNVRIQYGGPLTPSTAKSIIQQHTGFDGLYVGAPSLKQDFLHYVNANDTQKRK